MLPVRTFTFYAICSVHGECEHSVIFKKIDFRLKKVNYYQFCNLCVGESLSRGKEYFSNEYSTSVKTWDLCTPIEYEPNLN